MRDEIRPMDPQSQSDSAEDEGRRYDCYGIERESALGSDEGVGGTTFDALCMLPGGVRELFAETDAGEEVSKEGVGLGILW